MRTIEEIWKEIDVEFDKGWSAMERMDEKEATRASKAGHKLWDEIKRYHTPPMIQKEYERWCKIWKKDRKNKHLKKK